MKNKTKKKKIINNLLIIFVAFISFSVIAIIAWKILSIPCLQKLFMIPMLWQNIARYRNYIMIHGKHNMTILWE